MNKLLNFKTTSIALAIAGTVLADTGFPRGLRAQPPPLPHSTNYWVPGEVSFTETTVGVVQGFRVHRMETNWFSTYRPTGTNSTGSINGLTFSVPIYVQPGQIILSTNIVYGPETGIPMHFVGASVIERVRRYFFLSGTNRIYLNAVPESP